jgi:hypothetical protein
MWFQRSFKNQVLAALSVIKSNQEKIMNQISDFASKVEANFASIKTGILALDAKIQALQNSPGILSEADQKALDAIVADSATLATAANAVVPPVPPPAA